MKNLIFIVLSVGVISCQTSKKESESSTESNQRPIPEESSQPSEGDGVNYSDDLQDYDYIDDPDTALAYFLYRTYKVFEPAEYREEYHRLNLEYNKQIPLVSSIFEDEPDLSIALDSIRVKRDRIVEFSRERVLKDYEKYNGISGMDFEFLIDRRDSLVHPMIKQLMNNDNAPDEEKKYAARVMLERYQDSTYIELLK